MLRCLSAKIHEAWIKRAWDAIDEAALGELNRLMASIPSPTGEEGQLARAMVEVMNQSGVGAFYQPMDDDQGNAIGRIAGSGGGGDLLLYAPLDTAFSTHEEEECPWIGDQLPGEMTTNAYVRDGDVVGMGAENPKGYAACVVAAAQALKAADVPLKGSLLIGLGAGGMPTNRRPTSRKFNAGQGAGCAFMLEQGVRGDFAIIAKPGWSRRLGRGGIVLVQGDRERGFELHGRTACREGQKSHRPRRQSYRLAGRVVPRVHGEKHLGSGRAPGID